MSRPPTAKLALALATAVVAFALGWWALRRTSNSGVVLVDGTNELHSFMLERSGKAGASSADWEQLSIPPKDAQALWTMPSEYFVDDEYVGYRYKSSQRYDNDWPEYPGGHFEKRTNALGLREDSEMPESCDFLVVVAGDSHTDGLCNNRDGFPSLLEQRLRTVHTTRTIEVLNTGCTGYSFFNYLGSLRRFLPHKPDVFVVAFYGGNDFLDMVKIWHYFENTAMPPRSREYWDKLEQAQTLSTPSVANLFNQLLYFQFYPDQIDVALRASETAASGILRLAARHDVRVVFAYIPPCFSPDSENKEALARLRAALELSDYDLTSYERLAQRFLPRLRALGAEVIELSSAFTQPLSSYYWEDLHINLKGQQAMADLLEPVLKEECAQRLASAGPPARK